MAGTAFLPWEKWIARLLTSLLIAVKRWRDQFQRRRSLARSESWPRIEGTVQQLIWDSSCPREQIVFSYSTEKGYFSGSYWRWFDSSNVRQIGIGDRVMLRHDRQHPEKSVFIDFV